MTWGMGLLVLTIACVDAPPPGTPPDSGALDDLDGDGFPSWTLTDDPARADCDDADASVTPATEVFVPAGTFVRGEVGVANAEPVREITLSDYCIDRTEVTNARFLELLVAREAAGRSNLDDADRPLFDVWDSDDEVPERLLAIDGVWSVMEGYEDHPVVEVWEGSAEFYCAWRGQRLPTEAQWEKAARGAADARTFPWGDEAADCKKANYAPIPEGAEAEAELCDGDTTPVHTLSAGAGPGGVLGLAGNAAEWVSDWFDPDGYATGADTDPTGPPQGKAYDDGVGAWIARVNRGGNYRTADEWIRVSARFPEPEDATSNGIGFRCARALVAP